MGRKGCVEAIVAEATQATHEVKMSENSTTSFSENLTNYYEICFLCVLKSTFRSSLLSSFYDYLHDHCRALKYSNQVLILGAGITRNLGHEVLTDACKEKALFNGK